MRQVCLKFQVLIVGALSVTLLLWCSNDKWHEDTSQESELRWLQWRKHQHAEKCDHSDWKLSCRLTLVTAYFSVGKFVKGNEGHRGSGTYKQWLNSFKFIENPVVAYFDDLELAEHFAILRAGKPTKVITVKQQELWAFSLRAWVQSVISRPEYKRSEPNTVNAAYDCAMHAKYDVLENATQSNFFQTKYIGWIDVGIFRDFTASDTPPFYLGIPPDHHEHAVVFQLVQPLTPDVDPQKSVHESNFWLAGGFFCGRFDVLQTFVVDYKTFLLKFLQQNLTNTDQQVLLAMYHPANPDRPRISIQAYASPFGYSSQLIGPFVYSPWFFISHRLKDYWLHRSDWKAEYVLYNESERSS